MREACDAWTWDVGDMRSGKCRMRWGAGGEYMEMQNGMRTGNGCEKTGALEDGVLPAAGLSVIKYVDQTIIRS